MSTPMDVLIAGRGVAALVCAQRLATLGHRVTCYGPPATQGPTVLLGEDTWELLRSQFPIADCGHPIDHRDIQWDDTLTSLPNRGQAIPLATLVSHIAARCSGSITHLNQRPESGDWTWQLDATGRQAHLAAVLAAAQPTAFGRRCLISAPVTLKSGWANRTAMERLANGWLFLCPTGPHTGLVQWMQTHAPQDPSEDLNAAIEESTLVATRLSSLPGVPYAVLSAAPQILDVLGSDRWLAVGTAALTFDPLCGEGVGQAIRSALLASAVVVSNLPLTNKLRHYCLRHQQTFAWHLHHLRQFYEPLCQQATWQQEFQSTDVFLNSDASHHLRHQLRFEYQLQDFELVCR